MNKFFKAMFCVTFFSIITRALGFLLKIYLSRKMPSDMLGSYQVSMSIFAVLLTLVSSGIPVVLSRNVSFYYGKKDKKSIGSIVSSGLILTLIISFFVSIIILLFPNLINKLLKQQISSEMLLILLPALIFSSIYEVLRGALWGEKDFFSISFVEFIEQIIRILIIIILFETTISNISLTNKTALSLTISCIISAIIVIFIYFKKGGTVSNPQQEFKKLIKTSTPITGIRTISSIVSSLIAIIIPLKLMDYGYSSQEALSEFGIIMGMTFPILLIPSTLIGSLAVTIIPSISEQTKDIDNGEIKNFSILKSKINFSLRTTVVFSAILMPIFISLGVPICKFLFNNEKAGLYLSIASITMIPMGLSQISSSILNAIGLELKSLKNYVISSGLLILCILFLPKFFGTYALIIGYALLSITSSILNIQMLYKRKLIDFSFIKILLIMLGIICFSSTLTYFIFNLFSNYFIVALFISLGICFITTCLLILLFNVANFKMILIKKKNMLKNKNL